MRSNPSSPLATSNKVPAYFLIEVSVALALLLLCVTISLPSLNFLKKQTVLSEATKLHVAFLFLQRKAMIENQKQTLTFLLDKNVYFYEGETFDLNKDVNFGLIEDVLGPPSSPHRKIKKPITFKGGKVDFYTSGKMQPGTAYLVDSEHKYLYAVTVPVSEVSFVRKYYFDGSRWIVLA